MKHQFTQEERSKGGQNQPRDVKVEAGRKGFATTMERHPWMRHHLRHLIRGTSEGHIPVSYEEQ
jgi:general stress protein YciG